MTDILEAQLPYTLREADFPALGQLYRGKVRDNYSRGDRIVMITTDRVRASDPVLTTVPFKGELLNRLTVFCALIWTICIVTLGILVKIGS